MQTLSSLLLFGKVKALLLSMYVYFFHFPKKHMEHGELVEIL